MAVRYSIVEIPTDRNQAAPKDLLPWADPYIAMLIDRHHSEMEQAAEHDPMSPTWAELTAEPEPAMQAERPAKVNRIIRYRW